MGPEAGPAPLAAPRPEAVFPTARGLAVAVVIRPGDRNEGDRRQLEAPCSGDAAIREAMELAEGFAALVRGRSSGGLADRLARAEGSSVAGLRSFTSGIRQDEAAVRAGIGLEWSNGPVEAHVNRVKAIKLTIHGQAKSDRLRARVLHAG